MTLDIKQNHFKLFGLTEGFRLPLEQLDQVYRRLQAEVHPDRFIHAGENERRMSMQWAMHVNEAYQTLKKPIKRPGYLLSLHGIDPKIETNTRWMIGISLTYGIGFLGALVTFLVASLR